MKGAASLADVIVGPHSCLTEWVFEVVGRLASYRPERPLLKTNRLDVIDFSVTQLPICLTNYPSRSLVDAIGGGDARVILVIEDPIDVVLYLQNALHLPTIEAIRAQTATAVAHLAIGHAEHVHYVYRTSERQVGDIVTRLAQHLQLNLPDGDVDAVIALGSYGLGAHAPLDRVLAARSDYVAPLHDSPGASLGSDVLAAREIINPLIAMARGDTTRPVVWPTSVFTFKDRPDVPPPQTADISGPVRDLYYGPYFYLPPGRYRVEAILAFSDEIKDVPFVLELHGNAWLARAKIDQRRAGNYRGYFIFDHTEATAAVEIRLRNERGVAKGRLSLIELLFFNTPVDR